jgi:hypothetical protein
MAFTCLNPDQAVKVEVSYLEPTFSVSYLDVNICAAVTFPDVLGVEIITPTDLVSLTAAKVLADTYTGFLDSSTRTAIKGLSDTFSMVDSADITYSIGKVLYDYPVVTEALSYDISKPLAPDSVYMVDNMDGNIEFQIVKVINELQFIADQNNLVFDKAPADNISFADVIYAVLVYIRDVSDSLDTPTDLIAKTFSKTPADSLLESDIFVFDVTKSFLDSSSVLDTSYKTFEKLILGLAQDYCELSYFLQDYTLDAVPGDRLYTSDVISKFVDYARQTNDNMTLSSSGSLLMQGYSDITYFLEDYVGSFRTFT